MQLTANHHGTWTLLESSISASTRMSKRQAREWLAKFIELATAEILAGHDLRITGLGTFYVYRNMRARVTNPRTGAPIAGRMERAIKLRPSQSLRDALN